MSLLIKGGRVVTAADDYVADVYVDDERISLIGLDLDLNADRVIDATGKCQPLPGQGRTRADRFDDAAYDPDTGECRSNLSGGNELFETYFPLGALDADRGIAKAPDAIIDTRSAPPGVPIRYVYEIDVGRRPPPFKVTARLRFRAFPPFLVRAFAAYEAAKAAEGFRPSGPQVTLDMLRRIDVVDLAEAHVEGG